MALLAFFAWALMWQFIPTGPHASVSGGGGGISAVQSTSCTASSGTATCTLGAAYTANHTLFVVGQTLSHDTLTVSQTGNAFTTVTSLDDGSFAGTYLWVSCQIAGGSNPVTLVSAGSQVAHAIVLEVSGLSASCNDVNASATYSFASPTTGTTASTAVAAEIAVAGFGYATSDASTLCPGYTQVAQIQDSGQSRSIIMNYQILSATGTQSCTQSGAGTYAGSGVIGTFR